MARPLRIEFPGALYHLTSRGDRREPIFEDDEDRERFLAVLAEVVARYRWVCHAYCLMGNHYHLVVETLEGNLSQGMRHLNGVFTQASNRRHGRSGHLLQGRFKGILVDGDAYLLEVCRYVVLNPVRAGMVTLPEEWPWSSYRATIGAAAIPKGLSIEGILRLFGPDPGMARRRYRRFVHEGMGHGIWEGLRQQIYLGDENFVERMQAKANVEGDHTSVPRVQQRPPAQPLTDYLDHPGGRNAGIVAAYATGAYSYREIADCFGVHLATVGRVVRAAMLRCEN